MLYNFDFFFIPHFLVKKEEEEKNVDRLKGVQVLFDQLKRKKKKKLYSFFSHLRKQFQKIVYSSMDPFTPAKCHQHKCARFELCAQSDLPFIWIKWLR